MYEQVEKPKNNKNEALKLHYRSPTQKNMVGSTSQLSKSYFSGVNNTAQEDKRSLQGYKSITSQEVSNNTIQRVPVGNYNTVNINDKKQIRAMLGGASFDNLYNFQSDVANENGENAGLWIKGISDFFNEKQQWEVLDGARRDRTVNISGNVTLDDRIILWDGPYKAGKDGALNDYKIVENTPEQRISQNDADGKLLTGLIKGLKAKAGEISHGKHLAINIHDSSGPCNGCKDRIEKFKKDCIKYIKELCDLTEKLVLWVNIYYDPPVQDKKRGNVPTIYGYPGDTRTDLNSEAPLVHTSVEIINP
ncbi:hypothetical protein F0266_09355 [Vibrio coralliilyticus]|uniref:hypothetical protein n=1 Tax=Vibrio coralliilyticus TaxID=190893 RepID=UPI00148D4ECA|nr:hypothetical protein [Vibrio coralliilyticus]NOH53139.1 hypothetical protein [Vibrio coralliilyticus]